MKGFVAAASAFLLSKEKEQGRKEGANDLSEFSPSPDRSPVSPLHISRYQKFKTLFSFISQTEGKLNFKVLPEERLLLALLKKFGKDR